MAKIYFMYIYIRVCLFRSNSLIDLNQQCSYTHNFLPIELLLFFVVFLQKLMSLKSLKYTYFLYYKKSVQDNADCNDEKRMVENRTLDERKP